MADPQENITGNTPKYELPLTEYGNVDAVHGLPSGWHVTDLKIAQLKKADIPCYKACIGFDEYKSNRYHPIVKNIIPDHFSEAEKAYKENIQKREKEKNAKLMAIELTQKVVADCLYSINKEAKRQRDIQQNSVRRYQRRKAEEEKGGAYFLKEDALYTAIRIWNLKPVGYHKFPDINRDMYVLDGREFHINENKSTNCLGKIENKISAERKRSIPPAKASFLLRRFILEN